MIVGAISKPHEDGCTCLACEIWGDGSDVEELRQRLYETSKR